jgi:hypothetical protein
MKILRFTPIAILLLVHGVAPANAEPASNQVSDRTPPATQPAAGPAPSERPPLRSEVTLPSYKTTEGRVVIGKGRLITRAESEAMLKRYGSVPGDN